MKRNLIARPRTYGLLLAAAALSAPAIAQEAPTVTPPAVTPAPAPEASAPTPAPQPSPTRVFAAPSPVVQAVPPVPQVTESPAAEPAVARTAPRRAHVPAPEQTSRAVRAAPSAATAPAPTATAAPVPPPTVAAAPQAAPPVAAEDTATNAPAPAPATEASSGSNALLWAPIVIGGLIILGLIGYLMARRRREEPVYDESYATPVEEAVVAEPAYVAPAAVAPAYVEPVYPDPMPAAPAVAADDTDRPWIDIGLRPIRAEAEGALQVEVTVSNSGEREANDVRISTWMLSGSQSSDAEQALIDARSNAQIATVTVARGEDRSVDTAVNFPAEAGTPILVAEARYPLPRGGEGRIAATFEIEVNGAPENVEARLHDVLERA